MATSQNGYMVPAPRTRSWIVPGTDVVLPLRDGACGFVLVHLALWLHECVEELTGGIRDDWGLAIRPIRGNETGLSNHSSGTAVDLNATRHVLGRRGTFTVAQRVQIAARLAFYLRVIRSGIYYHTRADEMHWEIDASAERVGFLARRLVNTPRGRRIIKANQISAELAATVVPA